MRGATAVCPPRSARTDFNPRTPCGVRPCRSIRLSALIAISIHAPRAGCDRSYRMDGSLRHDFNPRTPCGVRLMSSRPSAVSQVFQSTHPVRGATANAVTKGVITSISIHAPRAGCDSWAWYSSTEPNNFNPRTPCGVRPFQSPPHSFLPDFNPRTPCGVRLHFPCFTGSIVDFNPRTPCGVRPHCRQTSWKTAYFNPRTPCGVRPRMHYSQRRTRLFQSTHPVRGATPTSTLPASS